MTTAAVAPETSVRRKLNLSPRVSKPDTAMSCPIDLHQVTSAPVPSDHLLQGRKIIEISHNGSVYRLQTTKLGKLILTK